VNEVLAEATLVLPANDTTHAGGKEGKHTDYLKEILADLQYMQRAYPDSEW
jgi:ring-1,2-phenylacetyl-CoA epoxidase subunit PaaC